MIFTLTLSVYCLLAVVRAKEPESAAPPLGVLVPNIVQEHFTLRAEDDKYMSRIELSDGSNRIETVQLTHDEAVPAVQGVIENVYTNGKSKLTYEAGKSGYYARYIYTRHQPFPPPPTQPGPLATRRPAPSLGEKCLKCLVG